MLAGDRFRVKDDRIFPFGYRPYGDTVVYISTGHPNFPTLQADCYFFISAGSPDERRAARGIAFKNDGERRHTLTKEAFDAAILSKALVPVRRRYRIAK